MNKDKDGLRETKFVEGEEVGSQIRFGDVAPSVGQATANYASVNIDGSGTFEIGSLKFLGNNINTLDLNDKNSKNKTNTKVKASDCNFERFLKNLNLFEHPPPTPQVLDKYARMTAEKFAQKLAHCADLKGDESSDDEESDASIHTVEEPYSNIFK